MCAFTFFSRKVDFFKSIPYLEMAYNFSKDRNDLLYVPVCMLCKDLNEMVSLGRPEQVVCTFALLMGNKGYQNGKVRFSFIWGAILDGDSINTLFGCSSEYVNSGNGVQSFL